MKKKTSMDCPPASLSKVLKKGKRALGLALFAASMGVTHAANAADAAPAAKCDPYTNYSCLDSYLGTGFWERLGNYYELEWGHDGAPVDPKALPTRRDYFPPQAMPTPPMPFTEWPYGGGELLGATRTGSIDSPLMVALGNTSFGQWMNEKGFQVYGWLNVGANVSTNTTKPGGNYPAAYLYTPNTVSLDQIVVYLDRFPDTVQKENIDWGIRFSAIYGENYRYTTEYGYFSNQLLNANRVNGFDSPMIYAEWFFPKIAAEGTEIRVGRYIAIPDIEAQLAPNNYMYTHSMTYAFDNYTNEGIVAISGLTKNTFLTYGVEMGTDTSLNHYKQTMLNPCPYSVNGSCSTTPGAANVTVANPYYPGQTMLVDPGAVPSLVASVRWQSDDSKDDISLTANGLNNAPYGYNNQQWLGFTYYHVFNDKWHLAWELYHEGQRGAPNANYSVAGPYTSPSTVQPGNINGWSTPFSWMLNAPPAASCSSTAAVTCNSNLYATVAYFNYSPDTLNNWSIRPEIFNDQNGQRTGFAGRYTNLAFGWQHWFSPQVEIRPEVNWMTFKANGNYFRTYPTGNGGGGNAFNGDTNATSSQPPNKDKAAILAGDIIWHF